jgi:hypothetical protein
MIIMCCRLYEVIEMREKMFLCMQLAPGGELFTRLTQQGQHIHALPASAAVYPEYVAEYFF